MSITAIDIHKMATDACHEYWKRANVYGSSPSMPDVIAEAFGDVILVRQQRIEELEREVEQLKSQLDHLLAALTPTNKGE